MTRQVSLPGKVYLTGAGPGSAKLLTIAALEVLKAADIVFHDDLVSEEILALIPPHVAVQSVGKRCGCKKVSQEELQRRLICAARSGQCVVRLKGGDPLIFARAQEEIAALRENGIPFEILPGVTAACAAAAEARIPLTNRNGASKLVLVSNHQCEDKSAHSWSKAAEDSTLVFYMPGGNLESLQAELIENALPPATPCLLISRATRPDKEVVRTTLQDLAVIPRVSSPSVLIVGAACAEARADLYLQSAQPEQALITEEILLPLDQS